MCPQMKMNLPCQLIGHLLGVCLSTDLHSTLIQCVVIFEQKDKQMPQYASLEELSLQPEVYTKRRACLHNHGIQLGQVAVVQSTAQVRYHGWYFSKLLTAVVKLSRYPETASDVRANFHSTVILHC